MTIYSYTNSHISATPLTTSLPHQHIHRNIGSATLYEIMNYDNDHLLICDWAINERRALPSGLGMMIGGSIQVVAIPNLIQRLRSGMIRLLYFRLGDDRARPWALGHYAERLASHSHFTVTKHHLWTMDLFRHVSLTPIQYLW
jgi:hypothetical protein